MASDINSESSGSDSGSTPEEERIRRLFQTCDCDGDGYIDSQDLLAVCRQLNLEHSVSEIMEQLGADENGRISYSEFLRRRMQLMNEINALTLQEQERDRDRTNHTQDVHNHCPPHSSPAPGSGSTGHWPTGSDTSQGAASGKHESWEFDSGARDLSPEPNTLQRLIEAAGGSLSGSSSDLLELANKLHLAALASLKGEILDLGNRLQHVGQERDMLERQLNKSQLDKIRLSRDHEERLDQQAQRYEERLTELHSIIAELSKKLDIQRSKVIKEEDEFSQQSGEESHHSEAPSHCTSNDNNATESCSDKEISQTADDDESQKDVSKSGFQDGEVSSGVGDNDSSEEGAIQACLNAPRETDDLLALTENRATSCHSLQISQLQEEVIAVRAENSALQEQLGRQEAELNRTRASLASSREERDRLQKRVRELQSKVSSFQSQNAQGPQSASSPTRCRSPHINTSTTNERVTGTKEEQRESPVAKMAERVRLKKMEGGDRHILGSELSNFGVTTTKVAEHLVHHVQEESQTQEIFQSLFSSGSTVPESKIREFEVEMERLNSRIEHLKSQNDLLNLTLEESKNQCDRLSVLIGKYESNNTALQLALSYSDQAIEACDVLMALMETEQGLILANCRAAGLGGLVKDSSEDDQEEITCLLKRTNDNRKSAENVARHFLQKMDRSYGVACGIPGCNIPPWDDLSSHSHTTSTTSSTSSSSVDGDFTKMDEQRLRDYILQLKADRTAVRTTVVELESVHVDPLAREPPSFLDSQKLDLENAVLMQELMAMKEDKAELKAQVYLLEKEKGSLELRLNSRETQEQAYLVHIEHLKAEVKEHQDAIEKLRSQVGQTSPQSWSSDSGSAEVSQELSEALRREKKLKSRIQELVSTLEKLTKNSELRAQQSAEFVNDLKRANSALVAAFEKAKKKNQAKVKKLEQQMAMMVERHNAQIRMLKQRIAMLEGESGHHTGSSCSGETPL